MAEDDKFDAFSSETARLATIIKNEATQIFEAIKKTNSQARRLGFDLTAVTNEFTKITKAADNVKAAQTKAVEGVKGTVEAYKQQTQQLNIVKNLSDQISIVQQKQQTASGSELAILVKQARELGELRDKAQELALIYKDIFNSAVKLDKTTGFFTKMSAFVKDIPGLRKFAEPFEDAAKAARQQVIDNARNENTYDDLLRKADEFHRTEAEIQSIDGRSLATGRGLTRTFFQQNPLLAAVVGNRTGPAAAAALRAFQGQTPPTPPTKPVAGSPLTAGFAAGLKGIGSQITGMFTGGGWVVMLLKALIEVIKFIKDAMFLADKQAVSLQRNLSLSQGEAYKLRDYFSDIKGDLNTSYKLTADLIDAQIQLSNLSAATLRYSDETLDAQIQLTKEYKIEVEEASKLNKILIFSNREGVKGLKTILQQVAAYANTNKILFNGTKILKQVSALSGQLLASFRGSLEAATNAVLQTERLGIALTTAKEMSRSLLNFEESISAEIEAELLTGRSLNFERARALSLQGKYAQAAEEIFKTIGGINEFENLNVLTQEAYAKATGMSVDNLADALIMQQFIGTETGKQIQRLRDAHMDEQADALARGKITAEQLAESLKQLDAQEKFNIALAKAKEIFTNMVEGGLLQNLADTLNDIVDSLGKLGYGQKARVESANKKTNELIKAANEGKLEIPQEEKADFSNKLYAMTLAIEQRETGFMRMFNYLFTRINPMAAHQYDTKMAADDAAAKVANERLSKEYIKYMDQISKNTQQNYANTRESSPTL
jgi:hypothetical protein